MMAMELWTSICSSPFPEWPSGRFMMAAVILSTSCPQIAGLCLPLPGWCQRCTTTYTWINQSCIVTHPINASSFQPKTQHFWKCKTRLQQSKITLVVWRVYNLSITNELTFFRFYFCCVIKSTTDLDGEMCKFSWWYSSQLDINVNCIEVECSDGPRPHG